MRKEITIADIVLLRVANGVGEGTRTPNVWIHNPVL